MEHLFFALFSLILVAGCGQKEKSKPQGQAKTEPKPALADSERGQPKARPNATNQKVSPVLWEFETGGLVLSPPTVGLGGIVYVGLHDKKVFALDGKTGAKIWEFETGDYTSSPALGTDGILYVGSWDNKVYAIHTSSPGLAKSPWPMRGQNAQHTGRVPAM